MMDLTEQIKGYARSNTEPAAVGPSALDESSLPRRARRSASHLVLAACLALLVACAAGAVIALTGQQTTHTPTTAGPVSVSGGDERLEITATLDDDHIDYGTTATIRAVVTNTSTEPITIYSGTSPALSIVADPPATPDEQAQDQLEAIWAPSAILPVDDLNPVDVTATELATTTLQPGQSHSYEGTVPVNRQARTGPVTLTVSPEPANNSVVLRVPLSIGLAPEPATTAPDALTLTLAHPQIQEWLNTAAQLGLSGAFGRGVEPTDTGWRISYGATTGTQGSVSDDIIATGGPGFVAEVATDGTVTITWITSPGPA